MRAGVIRSRLIGKDEVGYNKKEKEEGNHAN
jgi:hypothetical protein